MDTPHISTNLFQRIAIIILSSFFASLPFLFSTTRHRALDNLLSKYNNTHKPPPKAVWDPQQQYLVYLPFEGISNQFFSFQNAAAIAKRLNRTLVVPPITSNRHDRLGTNQPWSNYMDLEHMAQHAGVKLIEWQTIKPIDKTARDIISTGSRTKLPDAWKALAEPMPCQVVRNYGHDYFVNEEEDSIGADFAYQHLLDLKPIPIPGSGSGSGSGHTLESNVADVEEIVQANQNSTQPIVCLTFTFTAQFLPGKNAWQIPFDEIGRHARFLPRFASYVEDLILYRFGLLDHGEISKKPHQAQAQAQVRIHPHPPMDLGNSILDKGEQSETFLDRKPAPLNNYIAIHLRRGDIGVKCLNNTKTDCIIPVSIYKTYVDAILGKLPLNKEKPNVVLVSDTQSEEEKREIDSYGWYRLDHALDQNLLDASKVLGIFSPALIDSAVLTGRSAKWVIGSRRSTMSWLAAMRIASWYNQTIIYPLGKSQRHGQKASSGNNQRRSQSVGESDDGDDDDDDDENDGVVTWDRSEQLYFDQLVF
ncbi:hypothetical protein BG004_006896 [Podila humilis]|nr:hypothetical protein BG004_006896 [Podila humilis]